MKRADFTYNDQEPLLRAAGESQAANRALHDYYLMPGRRSLFGLWRMYERRKLIDPDAHYPARTTIEGWSTKYSWLERIRRHEQQLNEAETKAMLDAAVESRKARVGTLSVSMARAARLLQFLDLKAACGLADKPDDQLTEADRMQLARIALKHLADMTDLLAVTVRRLREEYEGVLPTEPPDEPPGPVVPPLLKGILVMER